MPQGQFPTVNAGQDITALLLQLLALPWAYKAVDTPRSNTTTLAADPDLGIPMAAAGNYFFVGALYATGPAINTGDLSVAFTWPTGSAAWWATLGYNVSAATPNLNAVRTASGAPSGIGVNAAAGTLAIIVGRCQASTAGNFQLEWAQNTSNATATVLKGGSWLVAIRTA